MYVCGSVDLGHMGNKVLGKDPKRNLKKETLNLTKGSNHTLSEKKLKVHKRKVSKAKETWEFNSNESISHVIRLS